MRVLYQAELQGRGEARLGEPGLGPDGGGWRAVRPVCQAISSAVAFSSMRNAVSASMSAD